MTYPTKDDKRVVVEWLDEVRPEFSHWWAYGTAVWRDTWWIYVTEMNGKTGRRFWVSQNGEAANTINDVFQISSCETRDHQAY